MKLAFFSDIHANLPALEAVLEGIDAENPDMTFCLGDLVGYNIWPDEVIELIRNRKIPTIAGNYDEGIGLNSDDCGCAYKTDDEKAWGAVSIDFTNKKIKSENREYLKGLPRHIRLELQFNNENINLLMVHGSPRRINEYLFEDRPEKSLLRILRDADADIMLFAHTHKPYHRILEYEEENEKKFCHAINIGSVGKPKDGDPRAGFVTLEYPNLSRTSGREALSNLDRDTFSVTFHRVKYDVEKAARAVEESALPNVYAELLRKAF